MSAYPVWCSVLVHGVDLLVLSSAHSFPKTEAKKKRESIIGKQWFFFTIIRVKVNSITCQPHVASTLGHFATRVASVLGQLQRVKKINSCLSVFAQALLHYHRPLWSIYPNLTPFLKPNWCSISSPTQFLATPTHFNNFLPYTSTELNWSLVLFSFVNEYKPFEG